MPISAKALASRIVSPRMRRAMRNRWEDLRDWLDALLFGLQFIATGAVRPSKLVFFGFAPGDDLLCTTVLRELRRRGSDRLLMLSNHAELFAGNSDPAYVRPLWPRYSSYSSTTRICQRFVRVWGGEVARLEYAALCGADRRIVPARHILAEMCARAGVTGPISIRPYLELTEAEQAAAAWANGRVVIQTSGMAARHPMLNKQWPAERFQHVVNVLSPEIEFVQLGASTDPALRHARDLRGRTGMREAAAILYQARLFVGTVGFLMHLARAVECPAVIVFGGREAPWQSGYVCNTNLYTSVPCAPCWQANSCAFDRRCMQQISADDVVAAIRAMRLRPRNPLSVETVEIESDALRRA